MFKKNVSIMLIILLALLLIALVVWRYNKKIENINKQMHPLQATLYTSIKGNFLIHL